MGAVMPSKPISHPSVKKARSRSGATRLRVLEAASALISDQGIGAMTMMGVGKAAGVTEMTVYNLFTSKNQLLAQLVEKYQHDLIGRLGIEDESTIEGILRAVRSVSLDLGGNPRWAAAISHLYFSEKSESATYRRLHDIGLRHLRLAVDLIAREAAPPPECELEIAMHQFANTGYALVHDLASGRIDGEGLADQLVFGLRSTIAFLFRARE